MSENLNQNNEMGKGVIVEGTAGGVHVTDGPLTTSIANEATPGLLRSDVDQRVVKIRPMSTPIDQISRMRGARSVKSMVVDYYTVDNKPSIVTLSGISKVAGGYDGKLLFKLTTHNDRAFAPSETILVRDIRSKQGGNEGKDSLVFYVVSNKIGEGLCVVPLNYDSADNGDDLINAFERIEDDVKIVRMGRAAGELDVQTSQFEALPTKSQNYCQIFKSQIEQSAYMRQSAKEVGWSLKDQEEVAIMDMRLGMERSFIFGAKTRLTNPLKGDEVLFTEGIWNQAGKEHRINLGSLNAAEISAMMLSAFTGDSSGSSKKVMVAGSRFIEAINSLEYTKVIGSRETVSRWGLDFNELHSKFGTLYVVYSEIFDECGHEKDALIIDPEYLTKYTHVPMKVERLDLKKSGVRNTDALVATEASCLVLRHPKAHLRVIG